MPVLNIRKVLVIIFPNIPALRVILKAIALVDLISVAAPGVEAIKNSTLYQLTNPSVLFSLIIWQRENLQLNFT